tara:strand:+ start:908 stop:1750 length:843 start_codon:yes stop_codon:yes gene_type:complete
MTPMIGLGNSLAKASFLGPSFVNSYSIDLDGSDDYVNVGNSSDIKLTATDTSEGDGISVALWVKMDDWNDTTNAKPISCFEASGGWQLEWSTRLVWFLRSNSTTNKCQSAYKPFESASDVHFRTSGWHLLVMTYDGRTMKAWVDNGVAFSGGGSVATVDVGSDDNAIEYGTGNNDVDLFIGAAPNPLVGGTSALEGGLVAGLIDDVAIWNKAIDQDAVKAIFNSGSPIELTENDGDYDYKDNLVAWWRFEEGSGTSVTDHKGTNTGTIVNGGAYSTTVAS